MIKTNNMNNPAIVKDNKHKVGFFDVKVLYNETKEPYPNNSIVA